MFSSNQFEPCCREMCLVKVRLEVGGGESVVRGLNRILYRIYLGK